MAAIASRYARALADVVLEQRLDPDSARQQLKTIVDAVGESIELRRVWESPAVSVEQKRAVLIDHRRIPMLQDIARQFDSELNAQLGLAEAEISSARPLSAEEKRELELQIGRLTGKNVRAQYVSNPSLIGGVMVRVGSTIYDGSVRGQLEKMKQELSTA